MVRRWIIVLILSTMLIVGCVLEHNYVHGSFNWLINSLESLQIEITENKDKIDSETTVAKTYKIHNDWHKRVKILKCLIWHTGIKDVEIGLARIAVYVEENDYTEAYAEIASLIDYNQHYLEDFSISSENIF